MRPSARHVAFEALLQMAENEGYSNIVIDKALQAAGLDPRDAGLASAIFYGVLERRLPLEHLLRQCLSDPRKKVDPWVWNLLLCGAYQILYLDRVPDSAAVNQAVEEAKAYKAGAFTGLVNGVLRNLSRRKEQLTLPEGDSLQARSLRIFHPPGTAGPVAEGLRGRAPCKAAGSCGPAPAPLPAGEHPGG